MRRLATRSKPTTSSRGTRSAKDEYIELDPDELEAIAIESKRVIDIDEFVPRNEIDDLYFNNPYYIIPDGEVGRQAFAVIREAIKKEGMVAIGTVMFTSREHIIALEARGRGLWVSRCDTHTKYEMKLSISMRFPTKRSRRICSNLRPILWKRKRAHFEPEKFQDHYENALTELLKKKQAGQKVGRVASREPPRSSTLWMRSAAARKPRRRRMRPKRGGNRIAGRPKCCFRYRARNHPRRRLRKPRDRGRVRGLDRQAIFRTISFRLCSGADQVEQRQRPLVSAC